ncbi:MAG: VanZ family protein [Verrucomicrobia bacterium]|nr:VanZ family protein [Verrucomicrobiota bacterium]
MSKSSKFLAYWLPLLIWMCVIFTASSDVDSVKHSSTLFEPLLRWLFPHLSETHVVELHHLRQPQRNIRLPWRQDQAGLALAIVLLYAASDELHQVFIPGRTALVSDVIVDVIGGSIGLTVLWLAGKKLKHW